MASWQDQLQGNERDAAAALISLFEQYGLGALASTIVGYVQQGYGEDTMLVLLQETKEYKDRFAANDARRNAGLPVLSPGEYIATERAYAQALQAAGMPPGFFDDPAKDFRDFLEKDIAPTEIAERAGKATEYVNTLDQHQLSVLQRRRGLGVGDLAAHFLDPDRALPALQKSVQTALLGAERERAGYDFSDVQSEMLFSQGITAQQARQGYGAIREVESSLSRLAEIEGTEFGVGDLESEVFGASGEAAERRRRLESGERARFGGSSATSTTSLSRQRTFQ
jgi:hypothetical protein